MKNSILIIVLACIAILGYIGCGSAAQKQTEIATNESIAVKTYKITNTSSTTAILATGILGTENEAVYSFKTGGIIDRIYVQEGQNFSKGQLLASIILTEINAGENQAILALEKAQRDYGRVKNLFEDSVATLEQLQNSKTAVDVAQRQLDGVAFNRKYAQIFATHHGFVTKKLANEGEVIGAGMPVLAINENGVANWLLKAGLSDKEWANVEVGNACEVVLDAYPDEVLQGVVYRKSKAADQNSGSFQVEIKLAPQRLETALGMFGRVTIHNNKTNSYPAIPYDALIEADGKNAYVFVPFGNNQVKKQPIKIASFDSEGVVVGQGLENVTEVVLTNTAFLNESSTITIIK